MSDTPLLKMPEISESQNNKFVTHNEALRRLEATLVRVLSRANQGPPGSSSDGDSYIVDSATGDWSGFSVNDIAFVSGGAWLNVTPLEGFGPLWVNDEDQEVRFTGSVWQASGGITKFTGLTDTPNSLSGAGGKTVQVKGDASGLEFVAGGSTLKMPVIPKSANYTVKVADKGSMVAVTDTTSARTITLPAASSAGTSFAIAVYIEDATNPVTVTGDSSETIDGNASVTLETGGDSVLLTCDGTEWRTVASQITPTGAGQGDVTGPASSTDNRLARFDGSTGKALQGSAIAVDDDGNLSGHGQKIVSKTSDFTLSLADNGTTMECASGSAFEVKIPKNSTTPLPVGYTGAIIQDDGNAVTVVGETGVTIKSKDGNTSTGGESSALTLYQSATDVWRLVGDLA